MPAASYRLQLQPGFGFAEAGLAVPYLARLGVTRLHLSPVLEAVPGSTHGYDVVEHSRISAQLGGEDGLRALAALARAHGLGLIVDTVPNHMAAPVPAHLNHAWFSLLRDGPQSRYAAWFDVDWEAQDGRILLPVLGDRLGAELDRFKADRWHGQPVLRYYDQVFPLRPGTEGLPTAELLDRQHYRLAWWRLARTELNYRRFFTVAELVAVRVENPEVFQATHGTLLRLRAEGLIDGFRIDHPDGLADPRGYLRRLRHATDGAPVVVEKILTGDERLPPDWPCAGTTGYDALRRVDGVLTDAAGLPALTAGYAAYCDGGASGNAGNSPGIEVESATAAARRGRQEMTAPTGELAAEVNRLVRVAIAAGREDPALRDHPPWALRQAVADTLAAYHLYRPYPVPGEPDNPADIERITAAAADARTLLEPAHAAGADLVRDLALGRYGRGPARDEFRIRFAQTASAVAAKGVEDTAFYRRYPLLSLNEVGGDPGHAGVTVAEFHAYCVRMRRDWPGTMTALSTHDTKRSADARARLAVLAEAPEEWHAELAAWTELAPAAREHPHAAYLLWQTAVAAWPIDADRLAATALKSVREAKLRTTWTEPDAGYEQAVEQLARAIPGTPALAARIGAFVARLDPHARVNTLSAALLHLTMPGNPDLYQGSEEPLRTLVDPDNRRPVDLDGLSARLAALDAGDPVDGLAAEKLKLTATVLRLRRKRPDAFADGYTPVSTADHPAPDHPAAEPPAPDHPAADHPAADRPAADHLVAFLRGTEVLAAATRLPYGLRRDGGWGDAALPLPPGRWTDVLTGRPAPADRAPLAALLAELPVALLVRDPQEP
ncbi:malto-oligosyltrehalose synthase [Streptacidiphilus sp. EB129]|uniref:malto-oligosyltrehalose synthase n=1 Tax=Streptacidiphilus sp. EB129 TaxID=3156262 RepID=UPI003512809E